MLLNRRGLMIAATQAPAGSGGGGGGWTPTTPTVTLAAYYDVSDLSTLFQDTAGSTPVTADGQSVKRINDKSGNGYHLTQTNGTSFSPTYRANSGKPYLELVGASAQWLVTPGTTPQIVNATDGSHTSGAATYFANNTGAQVLAAQDAGSPRIFNLRNNAGTSELADFNASDSQAAGQLGPTITAAATLTMIEVTDSAGTAEVWVNNSSNGPTALFGTGPLRTGTTSLSLGAVAGGGSAMTGRIYAALFYRGALGSTDRTSMHTWLAGKM